MRKLFFRWFIPLPSLFLRLQNLIRGRLGRAVAYLFRESRGSSFSTSNNNPVSTFEVMVSRNSELNFRQTSLKNKLWCLGQSCISISYGMTLRLCGGRPRSKLKWENKHVFILSQVLRLSQSKKGICGRCEWKQGNFRFRKLPRRENKASPRRFP